MWNESTERKAASVFSSASAESERRDGTLPRSVFSLLWATLIDDCDEVLSKGLPERRPSETGYTYQERVRAYEGAIKWAKEDVGPLPLSQLCAALRAQGLSADEIALRRRWQGLIDGKQPSRSRPYRKRVPVLHALGTATTPLT